MRMEFRRRLHEDHTTYHYDIILHPNDIESGQLDKLLKDETVQFADIMCEDGLVSRIEGQLRVDDTMRYYFLLTPKGKKDGRESIDTERRKSDKGLGTRVDNTKRKFEKVRG